MILSARAASGRRRLDSARSQALAWSDADHRDDSYCNAESLNGAAVDSLEQVTNEQYQLNKQDNNWEK